MRDGLFRFRKARGDGFAHVVERNLLEGPVAVELLDLIGARALRQRGGGFRCIGLGRILFRRGGLRFRVLDIGFHDPAFRTCSLDLGEVQTLVRRDPPGEGGGEDAVALVRRRGRGRFRR